MNREEIEKRVRETIRAEVAAVAALDKMVDDDFFDALKIVSSRKGKILVSGIGKSGYIAMKMAATLTSLGHQASFLNALDALHGDSGIVEDDDVLIVFSFSGASSELVRLVKHFQNHFRIKVVAITSKSDSVLAELADGVVHFAITEEGSPLGLAPMASTTASLVIADSIASALTSPEEFKPEQFAKFHPAGSLGLSLRKVEDVMRKGESMPAVGLRTSFEDVLKAITEQKVAQVVGVVDAGGKLSGAVADGDIRRMLLEYGDLRGKVAEALMNRHVRTARAEDSLQAALDAMTEYKVNSLLVVDEANRYIGFIHLQDIIGG